MGKVVDFPLQPIDLDLERVRLAGESPCLVLILPVVRFEREDASAGGGKHGGGRSVNARSEPFTPTDCN